MSRTGRRRLAAGAIGAAALLSGCAAAPTAEPATQICRLERLADLPISPGARQAIVPARLNGQAVSMLLDTGAERLTVSPQAKRALRLAEDRTHRTTTRGIGGTATSYDVRIEHVELGNTELMQSGAAVAEIPMPAPVQPPLAGIIGGDTLSDYEIEFNFATRNVVFWQRTGCDKVAPDWTGQWSSARLVRGGGNLMTLDVTINGQNVRALLDTGALTTSVDIAAAGRSGITAAELAASRVVNSRGSDGSDVINHVTRLRDIAVGSAHSSDFPVLVGPIHIPFADMLLGVDFLQHRDLWVAYGHQEAFIK